MPDAQEPSRTAEPTRPAGIEGSELEGPFPVGEYASALRRQLRDFARVQVFGEVSNLSLRQKAVYFELRDGAGALPCSMWRSDYDLCAVELANGGQVVLGGGCDYYPGSATSSPSFSFRATTLRHAGDGELLAQIERLRRRLAADGLFEPQKRLHRPLLPRTIGVVTGEGGKARDDVLAGLRRRGWEGRLVWAFAPVQDRRAAPALTRALQDLAGVGEVDVIVVARGGGSVMDLMAFSDETLCRTVALLAVPVIASVGHHSDRTLIDDVAHVSCSTPTHAAETAVGLDCTAQRTLLLDHARRLRRAGSRSVLERARRLEALTRAPAEHLARERRRLHQQLRELRAAGRRRIAEQRRLSHTHLLVLGRKLDSTRRDHARATATLTQTASRLSAIAPAATRRRATELDRLRRALDAHDPDRALERGYAVVEDSRGTLLTTARAARDAGELSVRFRDDRVRATVKDEEPHK